MATEVATFGSGCFWCSEAVFLTHEGVLTATSGYMGGAVPNPTYEQVCTGTTGHAEVVQVEYDSEKVTFEDLALLFFKTHDPTTLNRQGHDVGTQYRSVIFAHSPEQLKLADEIKGRLEVEAAFSSPIVTQICEAELFYPAENYHQNFYALNKTHPYCANVIRPKLDKLK